MGTGIEEYDAVAVAVAVLVAVAVGVMVAHFEYEACVAEATITLNNPIPLLCSMISEFGFVGSVGPVSACAHPCWNVPFDVGVLVDTTAGSSYKKQLLHLYTNVQCVEFTLLYICWIVALPA